MLSTTVDNHFEIYDIPVCHRVKKFSNFEMTLPIEHWNGG